MKNIVTSVWFWFVIFCVALGIVFYISLGMIFDWANSTVQAQNSDYTISKLKVEPNYGYQTPNEYTLQPATDPTKVESL